VLWHLELHEC